MTDTDKPVLDYLRDQFGRLQAHFDRLNARLEEIANPPVTLEFLATQQRHILDQLRTMHDDAVVSAAILMRVDGTLSGLVQEVRAMHTQHARMASRVRALEEDAP